ncbi:hypothetical protein [Streptosporangium sp. KLBMP 9127]|nr:hypothetical protein [Streptosporangium sp. KLBMP 9127]
MDASAVHAQYGESAQPGYEVAAGYITKLADTMDGSAATAEDLLNGTPRFEGWNLVPLAGIPLVGLPFVQRINVIADEWAFGAGILRDVLWDDSNRLYRAAGNYIAVEQASAMHDEPS